MFRVFLPICYHLVIYSAAVLISVTHSSPHNPVPLSYSSNTPLNFTFSLHTSHFLSALLSVHSFSLPSNLLIFLSSTFISIVLTYLVHVLMEVLGKSEEWNEKRMKRRWKEEHVIFQAGNSTVESLSRGLDCRNLKAFTTLGRQKVTWKYGLLLELQQYGAKQNVYF